MAIIQSIFKLNTIIPESKFGKLINTFLNSPLYLVLIGLLITISNLFALELVSYTILGILTIIILICSPDNKHIIPIYLFFTMAMSYKNGPIYTNTTTSIYDNQGIMLYFYILLGIIVFFMLYHFIIFQDYLKIKKFKRGKYLVIGIGVLFLGHILGGLGSSYYEPNNLIYILYFFGAMGISLFYLIAGSFNDGTDPLKYFVKIAITFQVIMIIELINIFITQDVFVSGSIKKGNIKTGWGQQNNFGGYMCMLLPFITYAAKKYKFGFIYTIFLFIVSIFIILTCSRTSILFAAFALLVSIIYLIVPDRKKYNKANIITISVVAVISIILGLVFLDKIKEILQPMINAGMDDSGRWNIWKTGLELFKESPFLGTGWFSLDPILANGRVGTTTPLWLFHNIVVQYLASAGIFGILCFVFFLGTLFFQGFRYPTQRRLILMFSMGLLIGMSLLDIFFFNYNFIRCYGIILGLLIIEPNGKEIRNLTLSSNL